jgi:hypothetical protein
VRPGEDNGSDGAVVKAASHHGMAVSLRLSLQESFAMQQASTLSGAV